MASANRKQIKTLLIGAGGHARVLVGILRQENVKILGVLDKSPRGGDIFNIPILGNDSAIQRYSCDAVELVNGIGSVGLTALRTRVYEKFHVLGYFFRQVIHPTATIAVDVSLEEGVQVMAGAVVESGVVIGTNTIINTASSINHECQIGAHVHIAPGCTLSGNVLVGEGAHLGTGTIVIQGVKIGRGTIVGAGSLVLHDLPAHVLAYGHPARVIRAI